MSKVTPKPCTCGRCGACIARTATKEGGAPKQRTGVGAVGTRRW